MIDLLVDKEFIRKEKERIKRENEEKLRNGPYIPPEILA